ncbi:hypothetical protein EI94DRAFT_836574 [Lactarius quietus]|nr:hypothetical protein EI94DRAFT_836574 [Lactarius quietus]
MVSIHGLNMSYTKVFTEVTWALSGSNASTEQPCTTFLAASRLKRAWIVQTASPLETKWKRWQTQYSADTFVMDYPSVHEITAIVKILSLDVGNIRRIYEQWGPSARTCVWFSRTPSREASHKSEVEGAAADFIRLAPTTSQVNAMAELHILFSVRPQGRTKSSR